ncbi:galactose/methyl galactoside ABC transporter ATP-binding protein MglA [Neobacillus thermocopriae]|uniref:Ribose/galactose/methyl galactoside import ATP-binding protein n=1 Tax=Neobacillus thermocopriae TaxID=1215031 RepID=A0A6B3TNI9_9BACI|nr:galactose/methyl galactoside ABC transporter ATP-binding protein MglA [Neobacillus thermocopriae]MED3622603.1 galactose/methyl galactoside ABC transporter ATP-binding protein MglA [Neobacillus thermocopriae]MED3714306.1 galactose/methyl galactoside ABC transporter ATP-binding protein MglA [Neobacillus thermocopriae]NEX77840.1 galactose/methyl galactoside ABC transporter ATP-binding protein MglA [Neobacillus thermocopriae]
MSNILEMINITKRFPGVVALDRVSLKVKAGSVHALMGENGAGKSTLMKCLFGIYSMDEGKIIFDGKEVSFANSKQALENGVSMVHQELNQVRQRNVMDNIWLGRYPKKGIFIDEKKMYEDTAAIFKSLDINIDPRRKVSSLSVSEMQMVEIAKAVSYDSKVIVMDEPTSSLTEKEVAHLFKIIRTLKSKNVAIIYISHKMEEILKISDEVTIMRDGQYIATKSAKDLTTDEIIKLMVGRDLSQRFPPKVNQPGDVILKVKNLTAEMQPSFKDINFELRKGEILGIAGLVGSKRTEVVEALFGLRAIQSGTIELHGKEVINHSPQQAIKNGFALVTEERRSTGIFPGLSISFNSIIANLPQYRKGIFLSESQVYDDTKWVIDSMKVKTPSQKTAIGTLSGGNQQKVIIGRWLLTKPDVLLLDEPTRGIDVGAKFEIYQLINQLASEGKGIIMISSEMPELLGVTDRILVMSNGRAAGIVETKTTSQEEIMRLAALY